MKKILIIALALMLALSLVACNKNKGDENETNNNEIILNPEGTGDNGASTGDPSTGTNGGDVGSDDPFVEEVFTDKEQTIFIIADVASVRSEARKADETLIDYAAKDTEFKSTGYSENWYRIEFEVEVEQTTETETEADAAPASEETTESTTEGTTTESTTEGTTTEATTEETTTEAETEAAPKTETVVAYVHKTVACVKDMTAKDLEEPITLYIIANALNVRAYYDFGANNVWCTLQQGDEVTAVAQGNGWYKIQLSDDAEGNPVFGYISSNEKYVSTTKPAETTAAEEQTTEAAE